MKIQVVTYGVSRKAGGVFNAVCDLFTNNQFNRELVNIISYRDSDTERDLSAWKNLPMQLFQAGPFLYSQKAKNALLNSEADICHMEGLWRWPQLWITDWKKKKNKPLICSPHGMLDPWIIKNQGIIKRLMAKILFDKALNHVDCFHALCEKELQDIRSYGIEVPVAVIPNGVNPPETKRKTELLGMRNKPNGEKRLLYLARIHPKKGIDILIHALGQIRKDKPTSINNWHVDIVGWGEKSYIQKIRGLINHYSLNDIITFHGGVFGKKKEEMFARCDAYILPSHGEGLPVSILEAWSWNLPVIMSPQCNIPEGFDAQAAIQISDDVSSCKRGLLRLFEMEDCELEEMGLRGFNLVSTVFTWDIVAKKMIDSYKWLLGIADKPEFVYE